MAIEDILRDFQKQISELNDIVTGLRKIEKPIGGSTTDIDAIHDNVAGEINPLTTVTPSSTDVLLIEDASDSWNKKKATVSGILGLGATDSDAIHDNVSSEISAITQKVTPADGDHLLIEDSAASNAKKRVLFSTVRNDPDAIHDNVASEINALTLVTPTSTDALLIEDASASYAKRRVTVGGILGLGATDADAIHDNVSGEINALTSATPATTDVVLIEDASASYAKRKATILSIQSHTVSGTDVTGWLETTTGIGIKVYRTTNQNVNSGTWTFVNFESISWESKNPSMSSMWSSGSPGYVFARKEGVYYFSFGLYMTSNGTGIRGIRILKNGVSIAEDLRSAYSSDFRANCSVLWYMAVNDYFEVQVYQNSGSALNVLPNSGLSYGVMAKVG